MDEVDCMTKLYDTRNQDLQQSGDLLVYALDNQRMYNINDVI